MAKICVFTGASQVDGVYRKTAQEVGQLIGQRGHELVYGGSNLGLMGEVSNNAHENGAKVTEIIPELWKEKINPSYKSIVTKDFAERKNKMQDISDAFISLPGGVGTLDEIFEVIVSKQIKRYNKPHAIVNLYGFYTPLLTQLKKIDHVGFLTKSTLELESSLDKLYYEAFTPLEAIKHIENNI